MAEGSVVGKITSVNEQYDKVLQLADEVAANDDATLTPENIEDIVDSLHDVTKDSASTKLYDEAEKLKADADIKDEEDTITVITDPVTGKPIPVSEDEDDDDIHLQSFEEMLADDSITPLGRDIKDIHITEAQVMETAKSMFGINNLTDEEKQMIVDAAERVKDGEDFSCYSVLPKIVKDAVNRITPKTSTVDKLSSAGSTWRNMIAHTFLAEIASADILNSSVVDFQKIMKKESEEYFKDVQKDAYWGNIRKYFINDTLEKVKKYEAEGNPQVAERYQFVHDAFVQSYTYENMRKEYEAGKIKVKKIHVEKFKRTCAEFLRPYQQTTTVIQDIGLALKALDRHAAKKFDLDLLKEFLCVFIRYTQIHQFKPSNVAEHTFMYFFIHNILALDMYNADDEEDVKFHNELVNNINEFIELIIDKKHKKE